MDSATNFSKVKFFRQKTVFCGESVYVVGSIPSLGCWNPYKALRLTWGEGDNWLGEIFLQAPCDFEYKYFTSSSDQSTMPYVNWESGCNSKMTVFPKEYHADNENPNEISVMSFNIRLDTPVDGDNAWEFRKDIVANVIKVNGCDFVGIQEAIYHQTTDLQNRLPTYNWYGRCREEGSEEGEAIPIFYSVEKWEIEEGNTFWLSDTPDVPKSMTYGNRYPRICTWARFRNKVSGKHVVVYNCHLDHESSVAQKKASEQIKNHIATYCKDIKYLILIGDHNVTPDSEAIKIMSEQGIKLKDTFALKEKGPSGTFHNWTGTSEDFRIDYIFIAEAFKSKEYKILRDNFKNRYPSDHFPIVSKITM